jgi:hypothetical protein
MDLSEDSHLLEKLVDISTLEPEKAIYFINLYKSEIQLSSLFLDETILMCLIRKNINTSFIINFIDIVENKHTINTQNKQKSTILHYLTYYKNDIQILQKIINKFGLLINPSIININRNSCIFINCPLSEHSLTILYNFGILIKPYCGGLVTNIPVFCSSKNKLFLIVAYYGILSKSISLKIQKDNNISSKIIMNKIILIYGKY